MGELNRGPMCGDERGAGWIDDGTSCVAKTDTWITTGLESSSQDELDLALASLQTTALNFGRALINDASVRENYVRKIKQMSAEILEDVRAGRATAEEGARFANEIRNQILDEARGQSSAVGRARAEQMKATGKTLEQLLDEKAAKLFRGQKFAQLGRTQRRQVFKAIVESAGKSRPTVTAAIPRWRIAGRACLVFTIAVSTYNIWTAENKVHAGLKEGIVLGGGAAGGAVAGAATGLVCGPGAPICSTALFIVGGIMGALGGVAVADHYDAELREFADWLSEGF